MKKIINSILIITILTASIATITFYSLSKKPSKIKEYARASFLKGCLKGTLDKYKIKYCNCLIDNYLKNTTDEEIIEVDNGNYKHYKKASDKFQKYMIKCINSL